MGQLQFLPCSLDRYPIIIEKTTFLDNISDCVRKRTNPVCLGPKSQGWQWRTAKGPWILNDWMTKWQLKFNAENHEVMHIKQMDIHFTYTTPQAKLRVMNRQGFSYNRNWVRFCDEAHLHTHKRAQRHKDRRENTNNTWVDTPRPITGPSSHLRPVSISPEDHRGTPWQADTQTKDFWGMNTLSGLFPGCPRRASAPLATEKVNKEWQFAYLTQGLWSIQ